MPEQGLEYAVIHAFNSVKKDGSGETKYFTGGNANEIGDWLSDLEIEYRVKEGYITAALAVPLIPPVTEFVPPTPHGSQELPPEVFVPATPGTNPPPIGSVSPDNVGTTLPATPLSRGIKPRLSTPAEG